MSTLTVATVKSNSSSPPAFQNTSGTEIGRLCRAWVRFVGTGTVAISAQYNVSSITDNGTGDYTANFTTALPDANHAVTGATSSGTGQSINTNTSTTNSQRVLTLNTAGNNVDVATINVAIFR